MMDVPGWLEAFGIGIAIGITILSLWFPLYFSLQDILDETRALRKLLEKRPPR